VLCALLCLAVAATLLAQPPPDRNAALFEAIGKGDSAKVRELLAGGVDPNARSRTYPALVLAYFANRPESPAIIAALLKAGADSSAVASDRKAAPQWAVEQPKLELLDAFLDNGVSPDWKNRNQESLLGIASAYGHAPLVMRLLERGAKINAQDDEGFTPLMNACQNRHVEVVRVLVEKGADKSIQNRYGDSALSLVRGKYDDTQASKVRKQIAALLDAQR